MKLFKIVTLLALAAAVVGCEREKEPTLPVWELTDTRIEVLAGVTSDEAMGKASGSLQGGAFAAADRIGLYAVANYTSETAGKWEASGNFVDDAAFTLTNSVWSSTPALFYPNAKLNFFAYAPYLEGTGGTSKFNSSADKKAYPVTIPATQNTATIVFDTDFMTAQTLQKSTGDGTNGATNDLKLEFFHRLAKLDVAFVLPVTYKGKPVDKVTGIKIKGVKSQGVIDMTTKYTYLWDADNFKYVATGGDSPKPVEVIANSGVITITPNLMSDKPITGRKYRYEAIVIPQTFALSHALIELEIGYTDGETEIFYYQVDKALGIELHAAKNTLLNLTIDEQTSLVLGTISIEPWGTALEEDAITTKLSNMIFNCVQGTGAIDEGFVSAVLTIDNGKETPTFSSTSVKYEGGQYKIQYDHESNLGGNLTKIVFKDGDGVVFTPVVTNPEGRTGFQIKGNPTLDKYDEVIAKLTFNTSSAITLTAL